MIISMIGSTYDTILLIAISASNSMASAVTSGMRVKTSGFFPYPDRIGQLLYKPVHCIQAIAQVVAGPDIRRSLRQTVDLCNRCPPYFLRSAVRVAMPEFPPNKESLMSSQNARCQYRPFCSLPNTGICRRTLCHLAFGNRESFKQRLPSNPQPQQRCYGKVPVALHEIADPILRIRVGSGRVSMVSNSSWSCGITNFVSTMITPMIITPSIFRVHKGAGYLSVQAVLFLERQKSHLHGNQIPDYRCSPQNGTYKSSEGETPRSVTPSPPKGIFPAGSGVSSCLHTPCRSFGLMDSPFAIMLSARTKVTPAPTSVDSCLEKSAAPLP